MSGVVLGGLIAVAAVVIVALPFLLKPGPEGEASAAPTAEEERRLALIEERDRTLAALKELEFDHRTGKIDDVDYRSLVGPLRRSAADVLQALDETTAKE